MKEKNCIHNIRHTIRSIQFKIVAWICNPATLEAKLRNCVGSIPLGDDGPSVGGWIVWPPVIQH